MATPKVKSVEKSFRLLSSVQTEGRPLSLAEIAKTAKLSVPTAYRFIVTLEAIGALRANAEGRYSLGLRILSLGRDASRARKSQEVLKQIAIECANSLGAAVHVGVWADGMVRFVAKVDHPSGFSVPTQHGADAEAYCTGVGKVLLAYASKRALDRYFRLGPLIRLTDNTITDIHTLKAELARIHETGVAIDNCEFLDGLKCIAVPIFDDRNNVVASISLAGDVTSLERQSIPWLVASLRPYAERISNKLNAEDWASL